MRLDKGWHSGYSSPMAELKRMTSPLKDTSGISLTAEENSCIPVVMMPHKIQLSCILCMKVAK